MCFQIIALDAASQAEKNNMNENRKTNQNKTIILFVTVLPSGVVLLHPVVIRCCFEF